LRAGDRRAHLFDDAITPEVAMTPEEHDMIFSSVVIPGREPVDSREQILRHFNAVDGRQLGLRLVREAAEAKDPVDLEAALIVCFLFGYGPEHLGLLLEHASGDWHQQHENLVSMLGCASVARCRRRVDARGNLGARLSRVGRESRAGHQGDLGDRRCAGNAAERALDQLTADDDDIV
jgi:hypothetical protein